MLDKWRELEQQGIRVYEEATDEFGKVERYITYTKDGISWEHFEDGVVRGTAPAPWMSSLKDNAVVEIYPWWMFWKK